jgi:NDP-sugar pyrophosphorylase family protein
VSIGKDVVVGNGNKVMNFAIFAGTNIGKSSLIKDSIIGWKCHMGDWAFVVEFFLGEDVTVQDISYISESSVPPHKTVQGTNDGRIVM